MTTIEGELAVLPAGLAFAGGRGKKKGSAPSAAPFATETIARYRKLTKTASDYGKEGGRGKKKGSTADVEPFHENTVAKYRKLTKTADVGQIDDYYTRATTP